jgi:hypothetical protein
MGRSGRKLNIEEGVDLAEAIAGMRPSQVVHTIQDLMFKRQLSRTVSALNELVLEHPDHRAIAAKALAKMGLWQDVSRR